MIAKEETVQQPEVEATDEVEESKDAQDESSQS